MIIYKVTNIVNGKMYIGQTVRDLKNRKQSHITAAKLHRDDSHFHNAIRKCGPDFKWEIIHKCDNIGELNRLEIYYIGYYDTYEDGYNLTLGGGGKVGMKVSAETRKKQSMATSGKNNPMYGRCGKDHPMYGKCGEDSPRYGKKHSAETKKKQSLAKIGENNYNYGKRGKDSHMYGNSSRARAVNINDNCFGTGREAAKFLGITPPALRYRILHKTKWMDYHYVENVMEVQDVKGNS